jgi:peptide-methionine (S)-S-oxide reductase
VGYAGGRTSDPTYHALGDHSEAVEVVFDPTVTGYDRLLEVFWASHQPSRGSWSRQYRNAVLVKGGTQRESAERSRDRLAASIGSRVHTSIEELERFWPAEGYHQKYSLRHRGGSWRLLEARLGGEWAVVDSTAAARLNGLVGGYGTREAAAAELERAGFSPEERFEILAAVR